MKGIYLTQEGKEKLEKESFDLLKQKAYLQKQFLLSYSDVLKNDLIKTSLKIELYQEILSTAVILPVEESWNLSVVSINPFKQGNLKRLYPKGVIIQPKQ